MADNWQDKIKTNIVSFLHELEETCKSCGRKREDVKVVFATKYLNPEQFEAFLYIAEEIDIVPVIVGENRVQEAEEKMEFVKDRSPKLLKELKLVMIGTLQTNKINKAIKIFSEIHSIDSLALAKALNQRLAKEKKTMPVFLEVNISGEESKHGFKTGEIEQSIKIIKQLSNLVIKGLMTMAPYVEDPEEARPVFKKLRELADSYHLLTSMGMSNDWKAAVSQGADMIRIGGRIFSI